MNNQHSHIFKGLGIMNLNNSFDFLHTMAP